MLRCTRPTRSDVPLKYASARRSSRASPLRSSWATCKLDFGMKENTGRGDFPSVKPGASRKALAHALGYTLLSLLLLGLSNPLLAQNPAKVTIAYSAVSPIFAGV